MKPHTLSTPSERLPLKQGVIALTMLVALSTPVFAQSNTGSAKLAGKPTLTVNLTSVVTETLPQTLAANGSIVAWQDAVIGAETNGLRVAELLVNVGDRVRKGQILATFASETVVTDLRLAEANLHEAQAASQEAKIDGERVRKLQGTGALSEQQIQQILTREQTAQARVDSAQAQMDAQKLRMIQTAVKAPDDGIISARNATVGSVPAQGAEMFRLIRKGRIEWRGEFTAAELEQVQPGQTVRIISSSGSVWRGKVRQASPIVDSTTRRGLAYVDVIAPENKNAQPIRPGAYVRGELALSDQAALVVPQSAIVARDGFHLVYVVGNDMRVSQRKVKLGRLVGSRQQVLEGVKLGEKLVASGGAFLSEGDTVQFASSFARPAKP